MGIFLVEYCFAHTFKATLYRQNWSVYYNFCFSSLLKLSKQQNFEIYINNSEHHLIGTRISISCYATPNYVMQTKHFPQ